MDNETKARFDDVAAALGTINTVLAGIIDSMATKAQLDTTNTKLAGMATQAQLDTMMKRMNDGFERVLLSQHVLQVNDDTLTQRVTRLEQDVRQLRGAI